MPNELSTTVNDLFTYNRAAGDLKAAKQVEKLLTAANALLLEITEGNNIYGDVPNVLDALLETNNLVDVLEDAIAAYERQAA